MFPNVDFILALELESKMKIESSMVPDKQLIKGEKYFLQKIEDIEQFISEYRESYEFSVEKDIEIRSMVSKLNDCFYTNRPFPEMDYRQYHSLEHNVKDICTRAFWTLVDIRTRYNIITSI